MVDEGHRGPAGVRLLTAFAEERGVHPARTLAGTGLTVVELGDPTVVISREQELAAVRNVLAVLGDPPGLGVELGGLFTISSFRDLGFALLAASSVRDALALGLEHLPLSGAFVACRLESRGSVVRFVIDDGGIPADVRAFLLERDLRVALSIVHAIAPPGLLDGLIVHVALSAARVEQLGALAADRPQRLRLHPTSGLTHVDLPAYALDAATTHADAVAAAELRTRLADAERRRVAGGSIVARVQGELARDHGRRLSGEDVARALHLAPRTLRRRLADAGTTFAAVATQSRAEYATALLREGKSVHEVALATGYADAAAFTRAFRGWTGTTPAAWRDADLGRPSRSTPRQTT